jgi:hypothetical protein
MFVLHLRPAKFAGCSSAIATLIAEIFTWPRAVEKFAAGESHQA